MWLAGQFQQCNGVDIPGLIAYQEFDLGCYSGFLLLASFFKQGSGCEIFFHQKLNYYLLFVRTVKIYIAHMLFLYIFVIILNMYFFMLLQ